MQKVKQMRNDFKVELKKAFGELVVINGDLEKSLPNTLNVSFKGKVGQDILTMIPEVAASTGSPLSFG